MPVRYLIKKGDNVLREVVPAILTDDSKAFESMVRLTERFADIIQIDVMDGKLVPSKSISPADVAAVTTPVYAEAHLMVEEPLEWIAAFKAFGARRVLFHYEMRNKDFGSVITAIRDAGMEPGLVVNPDTSIAEFARFVPLVDMVLFMSVYPGFYGAPFVPSVLEKIKDFRLHFPLVAGKNNQRIGKAGVYCYRIRLGSFSCC